MLYTLFLNVCYIVTKKVEVLLYSLLEQFFFKKQALFLRKLCQNYFSMLVWGLIVFLFKQLYLWLPNSAYVPWNNLISAPSFWYVFTHRTKSSLIYSAFTLHFTFQMLNGFVLNFFLLTVAASAPFQSSL